MDINEQKFSKINIGDTDDKGNIVQKIYVKNNHHTIYLTQDKNVTMMMTDAVNYEWSAISKHTSKIVYLLEDNEKLKQHFASNIAKAYNDFLLGNTDISIALFEQIEYGIMQRRKFAAKLIYLISSLIFVIINGLIAALFGLLGYNKTDPETTLYLYAIVFGGFGGYLSISININKLELESEGNNTLHIVTSITRVFIAMISSIVVLVLIKSNIFLGLLNESSEKFEFVIYSFCVLAGFSESFIPNILKNSEKNNLKVSEEK